MRRWLWVWVPLTLFAGFVALAALRLTQPKDDFVRSAMIGQPLPAFALPPGDPALPPATSRGPGAGQPYLLNIWASWCLPCVAEAPQLSALQAQGVPIVGIAIRDRPEDIARFLAQHGNPYAALGRDDIASVQFALGSSGVPETFVIDGKGIIRHQHIGDIRAEDVARLQRELREAAS